MNLITTLVHSHTHFCTEQAAASYHWNDHVHLATQLHEASIRQQEQHHHVLLTLRHSNHVSSIQLRIELQRRDAIRDVLQHKCQTAQGYMVVAALLIGCGFASITNFSLPRPYSSSSGSSNSAVMAFSVFLSLSFLILVLSATCSLGLQNRLTGYDMHCPLRVYHCGDTHRTFPSYFSCRCAMLERVARRLLLGGLCLLLAAVSVLMREVLTQMMMGSGNSSSEASNEGAGLAFVVSGALTISSVVAVAALIEGRTHRGVSGNGMV